MTYQQTTTPMHGRAHNWQQWLVLALSIWFFFSPWILQFGAAGIVPMAAYWNAWGCGVAAFVIAMVALFSNAGRVGWLNVPLGAWAFIAPWALSFTAFTGAAWDHWATGAVIGLVALWAATSPATTTTTRTEQK